MALPEFKIAPLIAPAVPNLPLGPDQYSRQYQDQFANVLRLYFNRLDDYNNEIAKQINSQNV